MGGDLKGFTKVTFSGFFSMAVQCPCFLVLNSNGRADFVSDPALPYNPVLSLLSESRCYTVQHTF